MYDLLGLATTLTASETALLALVGVIVALFVVTVTFSVYAIALRIGHQVRDRRSRRLDALWQEPVLAAIMDPDQIPAARAAVEDRYRRHFVRFVLDYTRRLRGAELRTLRRLVEPYLYLIAERVNHRRSEVRTRAVQTLGTLGLPKYSKEVIAGLEDPSPLVAMIAARYLARQDFPQYAPAVIANLHRFEGWNRSFLASMLARIGPEASPELLAGLADEEAPTWLRAVRAEALLMQLDPLGGDVAARILETADDRELVAAALKLLAAVGRPEHLPIIRERCSSQDLVIRAQALHALGMLGDETDLDLLMHGMDDPSPWAAMHAARGVREAGGEGMLREIAESDHPHANLAGQVLSEEDDT